MIKHEHRYEQIPFRSYVNYFADPDPLDFDYEHDASGDGISDADTYRLSSDPLIDGRAHPLRKDVFVEVDWMEGVDRLSDEAKWRIGTRFYENDIWLHIDARFTPMNQRFICILENGFPADDGKMGGGGELDDYEEKIRNSNWGLDRGYFYHQEKPGFHYSLLAYRHEEDSFLDQKRGNAPSPGRRFAIYTKRTSGTDWQVHTFLHEIGHNLIGRYYVDNPDHPRHNPLANHFVYQDDRDYRVHCGCDDCALRQGSRSPRSDFCGNCWGAMNFQWDGWRSR